MRIDLEEYPLVKMIVFPMTGRKIINTSAGSEAKIIQLEYRED